MLQINGTESGPHLHTATGPLAPTLQSALDGNGPVVILLHGYKFQPGNARHCPHEQILSDADNRPDHSPSWVRELGFGTQHAGLTIAFGWDARGTPWRVYERAAGIARALADLIMRINTIAPDRPVHIMAHSMGARVALAALHDLAAATVDRMILIAAAEFQSRVARALQTEAGRHAEVLNITSRENDLFDFLLERMVTPPRRGDRAMGNGPGDIANLVSLQLDDPETLDILAGRGFAIAPPKRRVCHWSGYRRPGLFDLYRAYLAHHPALTPTRLRSALPATAAPRWSRLLALPDLPIPLLPDTKRPV